MAEARTFPDTGPTKHLLRSLRRAEATGAGNPCSPRFHSRRRSSMNSSRALKLVVASVLGLGGGAVADGAIAGTSTCTGSGCWVYPPFLPNPGGGGGVGGGWGGGDGSSDPRDEYHKISWCTDAPGYAWDGHGCDLYNPPVLTVNGCGTAGGVPVPDFLVAPGALQGGAAAFGAMFKAACYAHDMCYGTHGNDKHQCDERLRQDMIADGQQKLGGAFPALGVFVIGQATAYARFLQWEWIEPWTSQPAYDRSQMDAACRTSSAAFKNYCDHLGFGS